MNRTRLRVTISRRQLLNFIVLLMFILLAGGNTVNPDIANYKYGYKLMNTISEGSWLYYYIRNFFVGAGISFEYFRLFLYAMGFCVLSIANKKLTNGSTLTYIFYGISLLLIDSTQTYNFVGLCFLYLAVACLITGVKTGRLLFVLFLVVASGFHIVFLFYIPFVFIYSRTDTKQLTKLYMWVMVIVLLVSTVVSLTGLASLMTRVLDFAGLNSYQGYFASRTRYGHYYPMMTHLVCCLFTYVFYKKTSNTESRSGDMERICFLLCLYGIFAFPFFRFQLSISRLTRNLALLPCISGIHFSSRENILARRNIVIVLLLLACFLGYFSTYSSYMEQIVVPFFHNNWILGLHQ